jgi:hypothetical protein
VTAPLDERESSKAVANRHVCLPLLDAICTMSMPAGMRVVDPPVAVVKPEPICSHSVRRALHCSVHNTTYVVAVVVVTPG